MGSWGDSTTRRADRMPTMRIQGNTNKQPSDLVKEAMMNDLGTIRINELPLDDTPNVRAIPQRLRRPPVITEHSEALNGYRAMAENGIDDAEAMSVRGLDPLGGPSLHRPIAGPTNSFVTEARRPTPSLQGMQMSRNGILLPPGTVVHRFNHNSPAASNNSIAVAIPQPVNAAAVEASNQLLPPHLRMRKIETPLFNKPVPENGTYVEASKPVMMDVSTLPQAREMTVSLPTPMAPNELLKNQTAENESTHFNTVKDDHISENSVSKDKEIFIFWTGSCKTWVPQQGKDCLVMIDLKVINGAVEVEGQSLFVMTLPEVFVKKHNMSFYVLEIAKSNFVAIRFVNPETDVDEGRYRLKFQDEETATGFQNHAAKLQRVIRYISNVAAATNDMEVEAGPATEQNATPEQPLQFNTSAVAAPVETPAEISPETKAVVEKTKSLEKAKDNEHTPKRSKDSTDVITDAFNNLSLNKVKDADMYKANRQRVRYSAEELLEQRSSAQAPSGITDVKIPLNRQIKLPRNTSSTQDVLERDSQSKTSLTVNDSAKLKDWIAGKGSQPKTEGGSQISMPGLSEAVKYQKAAAAITEPSAQASELFSSENKPINTVIGENENKADGTPMDSDKGGANDETQIAAISTGTNPTTSNSTDASASIDPQIEVDQAIHVLETSSSAEPRKSDKRAANSDASSDSAVGFQPSKPQSPSAMASDQNGQTKMGDTAPCFGMEVPAPAAAVIANEQDSSAMETSALPAELFGQTVPTVPPTATPATSFAVHPNILCGIQGQSDKGTPNATPVLHLASPQLPPPLLATPHMAQPHVTYTPQMPHSITPSLQGYPPAGIVTAVSITYHISHPGQPNGQPLNTGQANVHAIHHATDLIGQQAGRAFSPNAPVFQPQSQSQPSQQSSGQNRMRRGLESSIFATGFSGAKHAGSFTRAPSE
ncbi:hypothetical protein CSUB01_03086 [Colletotrichum sublineola]|uniref:Uncharacterized protein n=1 Tax=Colletotrichum sublineola TaxID=1173701 RepID=A0A066XI97_COLSU|nr:hypothetical protein CSUB01_03086 [Colletotrichum sublineola]